MKNTFTVITCLSLLIMTAGASATAGESGGTCSGKLAKLDGLLGIRSAVGSMVAGVEPGSAAESLGLRPVDLVVGFNGRKTIDYGSSDMFLAEMREAAMLSRAHVDILKFDPVTATYAPQDLELRVPAKVGQRIGFSSMFAILVLDVRPGGPADRAGIERGDFISSIQGKQVASLKNVQTVAASLQGRGNRQTGVELTVARWTSVTDDPGQSFQGTERTVTVHVISP